MSAVHEALGVLDRATAWIARDPRHVRSAGFLESTLGVWVHRALTGEPPEDLRAPLLACQVLLTGVDQLPDEERGTRVASLRQQVEAARSVAGPAGEAPPRVRVGRLLPEGLEPPPRPQPPPTLASEPAPAPVEAPGVDAQPVAREARGAGGREERGSPQREARDGREAREPRDGREAREPRDGREAREPRDGREARDGREPREARPQGEREDRSPRGGNRPERGGGPGRRGRADAGQRGAQEAPSQPIERPPEPRPAELAPAPPPPEVKEPEIRSWPLGHPDATGQSVETLGVYTPAELATLAAAGIETIADLLTRPPSSTIEPASG